MVVNLLCIMSAHLAGECSLPLDLGELCLLLLHAFCLNLLMFHYMIFNLSIYSSHFTCL